MDNYLRDMGLMGSVTSIQSCLCKQQKNSLTHNDSKPFLLDRQMFISSYFYTREPKTLYGRNMYFYLHTMRSRKNVDFIERVF